MPTLYHTPHILHTFFFWYLRLAPLWTLEFNPLNSKYPFPQVRGRLRALQLAAHGSGTPGEVLPELAVAEHAVAYALEPELYPEDWQAAAGDVRSAAAPGRGRRPVGDGGFSGQGLADVLATWPALKAAARRRESAEPRRLDDTPGNGDGGLPPEVQAQVRRAVDPFGGLSLDQVRGCSSQDIVSRATWAWSGYGMRIGKPTTAATLAQTGTPLN